MKSLSTKSTLPHFSSLAGAMMVLLSNPTFAAEHPLSKIHYDEATKINTLDVVMSIDWDINAPPAGRDKNFVENILKQTSQSLYAMTEGRVRLGKVSVYSNKQFMDNTDIQYLYKNGRANASISGFNSGKGMTIEMFTETDEKEDAHGKTIAHEFGHYLLGILDEYREEGKKSSDPGDPQDGDTPRNTIMNDHLSFETISTPTDYADPAMQNTAHFRTYKQSAWETIISPSGNEPAGYPKRTQLQAFQGMTVPDATSLTKPKTGWEPTLQVVYMGSSEAPNPPPATPATTETPTETTETPATPETRSTTERKSGPINVIILDTTGTKSQLDAQINAAQQVISAAGNNVSVAVYAHPYASAPVVPLTVVADSSTKENLKVALNKVNLAATEDDVSNGDRLFDWAETALPNLFPAGGAKSTSDSGYYYRFYSSTGQAVGVSKGRVYYYDGKTIADVGAIADWLPKSRSDLSTSLQNVLKMITAVQTPADTSSVTLLTTAEQTVNPDIAQQFVEAGVSISPVTLVTPLSRSKPRFTSTREATTSLYDLADETQGNFVETTKESEWARDAVNVANQSEGDNQELVAEGWAEVLAAGEKSEVTAEIAGNGVDKTVLLQAYWEEVDEGKINYTLVDPKGTVITPDALPEGVIYSSMPGEGSASYTVQANYPNHDGKWTSIITATAPTQEPVFHEITSDSELSGELGVIGGTEADKRPMVAGVILGGPLAVHSAKVTADVYSATTGEPVKTAIIFLDDGVAPDVRKNDGNYSADLSSLPIGEYEIVGQASSEGMATFSTSGATKKGMNQPDEALPVFQRVVNAVFKKDI